MDLMLIGSLQTTNTAKKRIMLSTTWVLDILVRLIFGIQEQH